MYEMYPDEWVVTDDRRPPSPGPRPRRRARKEHSVVPAILVHASVKPPRPAQPADRPATAA